MGLLLTSNIYKYMKEPLLIGLSDKAKIVLFSKLSSFYFDLRHPGETPGQDRGAKTQPQGQQECANPLGSPGGWSGLELTDTLCLRKEK